MQTIEEYEAYTRQLENEAGKRSLLERQRRYRATEKGRLVARAKARRYWLKVKDDPVWKAHKLEVITIWKLRKRAERLNGEHTLYLMDGCIKVNMGMAT